MRTKLAWGAGGFFEQMIANGINVVAMQIFNIAYGIDARLLGFVMFIPRFIGAFFDPFLGNLTDNTRSRWGRRRPWILVTSTICSILYVMVWFCNPEWRPEGILWWLAIISILYYQFFGIFSIAYNALGFELSTDYNERTIVQGYRMFFLNLAVPLLNSIYFFSRHPFFTTDAPSVFSWVNGKIPAGFEAIEIYGIRSVALILGVVMFVFALAPVIFLRENPEAQKQKKLDLWLSVKTTAQNVVFLKYVGLFTLSSFALALAGTLQFYIQLYYICEGDKDFVATLSSITGLAVLGATIISIPLSNQIFSHLGKNKALGVGMGILLLSYFSAWFLFTPISPYLSLIPPAIQVFGQVFFQMGGGTILADICDLDELETGLRREGMYTAAMGFISKLAFSGVNLASGFILFYCGYQEKSAIPASPDTIFNLRLIYILIPVILLGMVGILLKTFPLTHEIMKEVRQKLDACHALARK